MLDGIAPQRIPSMNAQEQRWLDNIKKAFYASDSALLSGRHADDCLRELCTAVDAAAKLHRSLRDDDCSGTQLTAENKKRFVALLELGILPPSRGGPQWTLRHARRGIDVTYSLAEVIYEVRCMIVHEGDNLNADEATDYHVLIGWNMDHRVICETCGQTMTCNGRVLVSLIRQALGLFITSLDTFAAMKNGDLESFNFSADPPLGSIRPKLLD